MQKSKVRRSCSAAVVCSTCLASDRELLSLENAPQYFKICNGLSLSKNDKTCYECRARLRNMLRFRTRALHAQSILSSSPHSSHSKQHSKIPSLECLSTLTKTAISTYDNAQADDASVEVKEEPPEAGVSSAELPFVLWPPFVSSVVSTSKESKPQLCEAMEVTSAGGSKSKRADTGDSNTDAASEYDEANPPKKQKPQAEDLTVSQIDRSEVLAHLERERCSERYKRAQFKCDRCAVTFYTERLLKTHNLRHSDTQGPLTCDICEQRFKNKATLGVHTADHYRALSSQPGSQPAPEELVRILDDSDDESEEECPDVMNLEIVHQQLDGSLVELEEFVECPNLGSDDEEPEPEPQDMLAPIIASDWEPPLEQASDSDSEMETELEPRSQRGRGFTGGRLRGGRVGRGRVTARSGRGRGRGFKARGVSVRGTSDSGWKRGQPLVERFCTDEELPQPMRDEIGRLTADRERRERDARARREALRGDLDVEEEIFYDCEDFVWEPMGEWCGRKETFLRERTGPTSVFESAYDAFRAYWDDDILSQIALETNKYAQGIRGEKFRRQWFETNADEIMILFAFWMMLSIIRMPSIKSCFSKLPIMRTDAFRALLSEDRYWNLNRAFSLASDSSNVRDPEDVLYPMGNVIDHLNSKFKQHYVLEQEVCIDESLTLWKGPLKFVQYIKTKAARCGIKMFQLCESKTGYMWSFFVYVGHRSSEDSSLPVSANFVIKLLRPILNLGHVLYMDNWFNSPQLARYLKRRRTDCVGTLRSTRQGVPPVLQRAVLTEGQFVARQSGDVAVVALQDRKRIHLISTCHNTAQVQKEAKPGHPAQYKLQLVHDYNNGMGGVDRMDQMLEPYLVERKQCKKWTKKLFKRLLNMSIQNARILLEKSTGAKVDSLVFRMALVKSIMDNHLSKVSRRVTVPCQPSLLRLTERHFIRRIPITDEMRARTAHRNNLGRAKCFWCRQCGRNQIKTVYYCSECEVALCLDRGCFEKYHTIAEPGPEHMT